MVEQLDTPTCGNKISRVKIDLIYEVFVISNDVYFGTGVLLYLRSDCPTRTNSEF